ncbi:MAG: hypothetical protein ACRCT2_09770 [Plesiomonas shigelloides]
MNDFQEWCKEILPIVQAAADGEEIEFLDEEEQCWRKKELGVIFLGAEYRIKPRTIRIGDYDVPEPMRVEPEIGDFVFVPSVPYPSPMIIRKYMMISWCGLFQSLLSDGVVHKTKEAAELHAEALISLTKKVD